MVTTDVGAKSEREQTDESLRIEREKTDHAIITAKQSLEIDADLVIEHAREDADAVLTAAREKADEKIFHSGSLPTHNTIIAKRRVIEDEVVQQERDLADKNIDRARKEENYALRRLLPLEREATDRTLLTERARLDTALANRDDFLGMVCHDLRDLLGGIVLSTELLTHKGSESEEGKRISVSGLQIQRYAARMNRLIGDLIDVASIDSGKLSIVPVHGDTTLLITEAVDTFKTTADAKGILLKSEGVGDSLLAYFDHDRMLQVLANLITNSIKFTSPGGTIILYIKDKGVELQFCVSDTGSGIPSDMLETVFERFWQVGKNDRRGLGLGLYISKCIVESYGGKIWVESKFSEGSQFFFTLPK
jgi:signal transduction histidine kinase